jgi:hypothetical protein
VAAPLVTLPIVRIMLLRFSAFSVHLFRARDGSSTWYFRFSEDPPTFRLSLDRGCRAYLTRCKRIPLE